MSDLTKLIEQAEQRLAALKIFQETGDPGSVMYYQVNPYSYVICSEENPPQWLPDVLYKPNPDYVRPEKDTWPKAFMHKAEIWICKDACTRFSYFCHNKFSYSNGASYDRLIEIESEGVTQIPLSRAYELVSWPRYFKFDNHTCYKAYSPTLVKSFRVAGSGLEYCAGDVKIFDRDPDITEITAAEFEAWQRSFSRGKEDDNPPQRIGGLEIPAGYVAYPINEHGNFEWTNGWQFYESHRAVFIPKQSTILWSDGRCCSFGRLMSKDLAIHVDSSPHVSDLNEYVFVTPIAVLVEESE